MKKTIKDLSAREKMRLICADGLWYTYSCDGKIPVVAVTDGPVGVRKEVKNDKGEMTTLPSIAYPSAQSLANTWDVDCARLVGECLADDCYERQADILLGPAANVKRHPLNGRNFEYFSEDPLLAGEMARSYITGVQSRGIGACLKHFCCNNLEYNRFEQSSEVDERTLREIYYVPFELGCKAKPVSMMSAYNRINGKYASEYKKGFDVLRDEFGFDGVMYSDWEAVRDRATAAIAGCDIEFPYNGDNYEKLLSDYDAGVISDEQIDACASRVVDLAYRCKDMQKGKGVKRTVDERLSVARQVAAESIVLLKNEGGLLPLKRGARVAVSGCYAKPERNMIAGGGSSNVVSLSEKADLAELLKARLGGEVNFETMFHYDKVLGSNSGAAFAAKPNVGKINAAVADASVICVGTGAPFEYESFDRPTMKLPVAQERAILELAAVNPDTVVALFAGSAIDVGAWADKVKAIVYVGFCGERGIDALCDVLCGNINPSGKLSETLPVGFEATPVADGYIDCAVTRYAEGLDVGYRYYDRRPQNIAFPFGHGLSYSSFEYSGLKIEANGLDATVRFSVKNASGTDGKEVAQLYVSELAPVVYRPVKELKGFVKTEIKSGETSKIEIKLDSRAFAYYSTADDGWRVNDGAFRILIGSSSRDIRLEATIIIKNGVITVA